MHKEINEILKKLHGHGNNCYCKDDGSDEFTNDKATQAIEQLIDKARIDEELHSRIDELERLPLDNRGSGGVWISMSMGERDRRIAELLAQLNQPKESK